MGNKSSFKNEIPWINVRLKFGMVSPHTHSTWRINYCAFAIALSDAPKPHGVCRSAIWWRFINTPYYQPSHTPQGLQYLDIQRAKNKLQQIQRYSLLFITKAYRTVSYEAHSAIAGIMPIDQAMHLYRVSQEECARLRESVPYVKVYRYNPKHL
jgi:hypothetical protein